MKDFNINDKILVKLTDRGILKYVSSFNRNLPPNLYTSVDLIKQSMKDGFLEIQMYKLVSYFFDENMPLGAYISMHVKMRVLDQKNNKAKENNNIATKEEAYQFLIESNLEHRTKSTFRNGVLYYIL